jgi:hypothetical protein
LFAQDLCQSRIVNISVSVLRSRVRLRARSWNSIGFKTKDRTKRFLQSAIRNPKFLFGSGFAGLGDDGGDKIVDMTTPFRHRV